MRDDDKPPGSEAPLLYNLIPEEIAVLDALISARAEAARNHARHTGELQTARVADDVQAFARAKTESDRLTGRCEALKLAVEIARETFRRRALTRAEQNVPASFSNL